VSREESPSDQSFGMALGSGEALRADAVGNCSAIYHAVEGTILRPYGEVEVFSKFTKHD